MVEGNPKKYGSTYGQRFFSTGNAVPAPLTFDLPPQKFKPRKQQQYLSCSVDVINKQ
jgi:hypothetical protein